ncbi:MAG: VacB/RNase II family 3'-5' exoribonuclease [Phycisphaerales bacterium]|nr:VacB/RNase II family 3'-5' exoribonuclease [Phycisphaerae bacterium]NNF41878.1 VacB/RNase II family 3'-5' exoribonuclease [Phycisphaerales bacterium]NNM27149.1 VacB/RNase II family 3'-5' exoribonuclease [Phycisphaerales bacterium]
MPLRYTTRIVEHLARSNERSRSLKQLHRELRIEIDERDAFAAAIATLEEEGRIERDADERFQLPRLGDEIVGWFRLNPRGFGFIIPRDPVQDGDLFVPRGSSRDAISGDLVRAEVIRQPWRARAGRGKSDAIGRIVEVLERGQEHFVGVLQRDGKRWFVKPDGRSLRDPVLIRDPHAKNAKPGDKVVIELVHYPEDDAVAEGVITKVLGEAGRPDVETQAVIEAHGLRTEFPGDVMADAKDAARGWDETDPGEQGRDDLTAEFIFTIDPPDAKDFDDAISIEFDEERGEWTLGVHIADVARFVKRGSALDVEAHTRGNSVYLPRLVIPMLPEVLSNGVCSLQEGVPRLTKSVFITLDRRGRVVDQRAAATIIRSRKRLTYLEAQALIDGDVSLARQHARTDPVYTDELIDALRQADRLARTIRKRRLRDGMIVLNLPEVELVFDDDGHVIDAVPEDDAFTHTLIEMFMVEANEAVARLFDAIGVPVLRRIHPDPSFSALEELQMYALAVQHRIPDEPTREDMQRLLDATRKTPAARAIHFALLRTFSKATYSPAMIGHFALASDHYAHFTSPIRRYPDLLTHRALTAFLELTENGHAVPGGRKRLSLGKRLLGDSRVPDEAQLLTLGRHLSETEQAAEAAERELRSFLVMQFLHENHLGDDFTGVITGVTSAGVFVSIERFLVEGLVRRQDMSSASDRPDQWSPEESTGRMIAQRSRAVLGIGDIVTVQIVNVDLASRHLDLMITKMPERSAHETASVAPRHGSGGKGREKGKRKGYKKGRRGKRSR